MLDRKSKGKGAALFQKLIMRLMNGTGILPANVQFEFDEIDLGDELQEANVRKARAEERAARIASGELLEIEARTLAVESGDLPQELFDEYEDQFDPDEEEEMMPDQFGGGGGAFSATGSPAMVEGEEQTGSTGDAMVADERALKEERAGPSDDRLDFEDVVTKRIEGGMLRAQRLLTASLQDHDSTNGN